MQRATYQVVPLMVLILAVVACLALLPESVVDSKYHELRFALPPSVLRIASLQFKEVAADISFLNALSYVGGIKTQKDTGRYLPEEYAWIHGALGNSAALDPYFLDPYNLMNSVLIWDRYKVEEVNALIARGAETRKWDSLLPFYAGFNYYYFLDNGDKSFKYLTEASKREDGNPFYDNFAARVAYKANKTELAIAYLEEQIRQAELEGRKNTVEPVMKRLDTLKGILKIEVALKSYQKLFDKLPTTVSELVTAGLLATIPKEPSGGKYFIDSGGRVHSDKDLK